jgi:hypothetical protein
MKREGVMTLTALMDIPIILTDSHNSKTKSKTKSGRKINSTESYCKQM